jgi:Straboviridae/Ackermannviridae/Kyanoviridae exonuclease subunit 1
MKVALITDTHWGVRGDKLPFLENNKRFLDNVFFPYLTKNGIKRVAHLGDLFDRRKYINFYTKHRLRTDFLEPMAGMGIEADFLVGNHDTFYKNTNLINAHTELFKDRYSSFTIHPDPVERDFGGAKVCMVPWMCADNRKKTIDLIERTDARICMGHLELAGFEMYEGSFVSYGTDPQLFDRFDITVSGHYHHRSSNGKVHYLGSHAEFTWADYDDWRGFNVLDTETLRLEFVVNPYTMFRKVWYNDEGRDVVDIMREDFDSCSGKIVKVIVSSKSNPYWFDLFMERLEKADPSDVVIVEDHMNMDLDDEDLIDDAESTIDIFKKYIAQLGADESSKQELEAMIVELYNEAQRVG